MILKNTVVPIYKGGGKDGYKLAQLIYLIWRREKIVGYINFPSQMVFWVGRMLLLI